MKLSKPKRKLTAKAAKKSPVKNSRSKEHLHYHKDGTLWAKGEMTADVMTGYWEWFRKDGTKLRSGHFDAGQQIGEWITYDREGKVYKVTQMKSKPVKVEQEAIAPPPLALYFRGPGVL